MVGKTSNQTKCCFPGEGMNGLERDKRLRPERPKKENPDFDYEFSLVPENLVWVKKEQMPLPFSQQNAVSFEKLKDGPSQGSQVTIYFIPFMKVLTEGF